MIVDPLDFLRTAELLVEEEQECHIRTAIGRSYYAVFLFFRKFLAEHGLKKTKQPSKGVHAFVQQCFTFCNIKEGAKAARRLNDLNQSRTDADYKLEKQLSTNESSDALALAKKAVNNFKQSTSDINIEDLIENATQYAKSKDWV